MWLLVVTLCLSLRIVVTTASLQCGSCVSSYNQLTCPDHRDNERIKVSISDYKEHLNGLLLVQCRIATPTTFPSLLQGCDFSHIRYVAFKWCPFFNASFGDVLTEMGVVPENLTTLSFTDLKRQGHQLQEWHLDGLSNLKKLEISSVQFDKPPPRLLEPVPLLQFISLKDNNLHTIPPEFFSYTPNLTDISIQSNRRLSSLPRELFANLSKLRKLTLFGNEIMEIDEELFTSVPQLTYLELSRNRISQLNTRAFLNLPKLETFLANNNAIETLPHDIFYGFPKLDTVKFQNNRLTALPAMLLAKSKNVSYFDIGNNRLTDIPVQLFEGQTNLTSLLMKRNSLARLPAGVFFNLTKLKVLDLQSNVLEELPAGDFAHMRKLAILILKNNSLSELPEGIFKNCESLKNLYLSHNKLSKLQTTSFPHPKTSLEFLDLGTNNLSFSAKTPDDIIFEQNFPLAGLVSLKNLKLNNNKLTAIPQAFSTNFQNLTKVDLTKNFIKTIHSKDLLFKQDEIEILLQSNEIETISLNDNNILEGKTVKMYLEMNPLVCDCRLYHFVKLLQGKSAEDAFKLNVLDSSKLMCTDPQHPQEAVGVVGVAVEGLECRYEGCPGPCGCAVRPHYQSLFIDCARRGLTDIPHIQTNYPRDDNYSLTLDLAHNSIASLEGLQAPEYATLVNLSLANNSLAQINASQLPEELQVLDVRGNALTYLPTDLLRVFNVKNVSLSLGGNPWTCSCNLVSLHTFLQDPERKVIDVHNMLCADRDEDLISLTEDDLCPVTRQPWFIASVTCFLMVVFVSFVLVTVLLYKNVETVKVWLYERRWCLWVVAREEIGDENKKYDVFISYSNQDEEFVNNNLVQRLEYGDPKYKVCLPYRDRLGGDFLQSQIDRNIEDSRRTIVVLSPHFNENVWGHIEFKTAHSKSLKDQKNRIIVVVLNGLPPESALDEELRLYLTTRTYLEWGQPKFWEKLRYAMPHPQHYLHRRRRKRTNTHTLNPNLELQGTKVDVPQTNGHVVHM